MRQLKLSKNSNMLLPNFKKALAILKENNIIIDDNIKETYENYIFSINGNKFDFFKLGKADQINTTIKTINMLNEMKGN